MSDHLAYLADHVLDRGSGGSLDLVKLGADVGIAVGPVGAGAAGATAALSADIISFSRSKGLYGGISLDGSVIAVTKASGAR